MLILSKWAVLMHLGIVGYTLQNLNGTIFIFVSSKKITQ